MDIYIRKDFYMGIVNEYIDKIINKINGFKYNKEKPWLKYYDRMPEFLNYYNE